MVMRIFFERFSVFFISFLTVLTQLSVYVLFGGFVISKQVFNDFQRFGDSFGQKIVLFVKKFCFAVWS